MKKDIVFNYMEKYPKADYNEISEATGISFSYVCNIMKGRYSKERKRSYAKVLRDILESEEEVYTTAELVEELEKEGFKGVKRKVISAYLSYHLDDIICEKIFSKEDKKNYYYWGNRKTIAKLRRSKSNEDN